MTWDYAQILKNQRRGFRIISQRHFRFAAFELIWCNFGEFNWCLLVWFGAIWCDIWYDFFGAIWCDTWCDIWYNLMWYFDTIWCDVVVIWYDLMWCLWYLIRFDAIWCAIWCALWCNIWCDLHFWCGGVFLISWSYFPKPIQSAHEDYFEEISDLKSKPRELLSSEDQFRLFIENLFKTLSEARSGRDLVDILRNEWMNAEEPLSSSECCALVSLVHTSKAPRKHHKNTSKTVFF